MKTIDKFLNFLISLLLLPVMMSCSDTDLDVSDAPLLSPETALLLLKCRCVCTPMPRR